MLAVVIITVGEMIVMPTSQTLAAGFARTDMRGRYMAVFGLSISVPAAIGPLAAGIVLDNYHAEPAVVPVGSAVRDLRRAVSTRFTSSWATQPRFAGAAVAASAERSRWKQSMGEMEISPIAHVIQLSVAPVFLLSGIGAILAVMTSRLGRIIDRARTLEAQLETRTSRSHRDDRGRPRDADAIARG